MRMRRPSPALVVSGIALGVALGGTSYAVTRLPADSVGTKQLKAKAVTRAKISDRAVTGAKVARDGLTGADIAEGSLGTVPAARRAADALHAGQADRAGAADHANSAAALDVVVFRAATGSVAAAEPATDTSPTTTTQAIATARCDPGQRTTGGGVQVEEGSGLVIGDDFPSSTTTWTGRVENSDPAAHTFTVYVICVGAPLAG